MNGPNRNAPDPSVDFDRIAEELAALGEDPLPPDGDDTDGEFGFVAAGGRPSEDIDVSTVQTLASWASPPLAPLDDGNGGDGGDGDDDALSEIAQARVWRTVELRTRGALSEERSPSRSTGPVVLGIAVALLAIAAGIVLVPVLTPDAPNAPDAPDAPDAPGVATRDASPSVGLSAEELDVMSMQARASLDALDRLSGEPRGAKRVEALAADYARRLEAQRGGQG